MAIKKITSKIHKPAALVFLLVVLVCVGLILTALYRSSDKNDRKFMPTKHHGIKYKKNQK